MALTFQNVCLLLEVSKETYDRAQRDLLEVSKKAYYYRGKRGLLCVSHLNDLGQLHLAVQPVLELVVTYTQTQTQTDTDTDTQTQTQTQTQSCR